MWRGISQRLEGSLVVLEPLEERHEQGLFEAAQNKEIWLWMPSGGEDDEGFHNWMRAALETSEAGAEAAFATLDARSGAVIGSTRYLALRPEHLSLEIGWTWISPSQWRTGANVEAKLLMMEHAFESLGCRRVEFKTDVRNERSRRALEALPAHFEGVFRKHMIVNREQDKSGRRDSAYYSVIDDEWPEVKANLRRRLDL